MTGNLIIREIASNNLNFSFYDLHKSDDFSDVAVIAIYSKMTEHKNA